MKTPGSLSMSNRLPASTPFDRFQEIIQTLFLNQEVQPYTAGTFFYQMEKKMRRLLKVVASIFVPTCSFMQVTWAQGLLLDTVPKDDRD